MNDATSKIDAYCQSRSTLPSPLLAALERETYLKTLAPQMLSGPIQGRFLSLLSHLVQPRLILEIGTFTGYGTLCLAEGLHPDGKLITIDINPELRYISDRYFAQSSYHSQIKSITGDAKNIIVAQDYIDIDIAFIDAAKAEYPVYFDLLIDRVRPGGLLIADNVLWSGKVVEKNNDSDTKSIRAFNEKIAEDDRVHQMILPIRDGLMIMRKC